MEDTNVTIARLQEIVKAQERRITELEECSVQKNEFEPIKKFVDWFIYIVLGFVVLAALAVLINV